MTQARDRYPDGIAPAYAGEPAVHPRLSAADLTLQIWRAKWLALAIALPIWLAGTFVALQVKPVYTSTARLYVQFSDRLSRDMVIDQEIELLRSQAVIEATVSRFPLARLDAKLARARDKALSTVSGDELQTVDARYLAASLITFYRHTQVRAPGASPMIDVAFSHPEPTFAAEALNAWLAAYLNYRASLTLEARTDTSPSPRKLAERILLEAEDAMRSFLREHELNDYDQARDAALGLQMTLNSELSQVRANGQAVQARIAKTVSQMQETPVDETLFVEDASGETLLLLRLQRAQLLSRYTEDSQVVQAVDREIEAVKDLLVEDAEPIGRVRRGPNPTYQLLEAELNRAEADAAALARQRADLQAQLQAVTHTLDHLAALAPEWSELQRQYIQAERDVKAISLLPAGDGVRPGIDVRILESARLPVFARSQRDIILALAIGLGLLTGLVGALIRAITRSGFASASSLALTTGLPVLASVRRA